MEFGVYWGHKICEKKNYLLVKSEIKKKESLQN